MIGQILVGSSPGATAAAKLKVAFYRALRTLIQGLAAAFPSAGAGAAILSTGFWKTFGVTCLTAVITAVATLLQNLAAFLPDDPTQQPPPPKQR